MKAILEFDLNDPDDKNEHNRMLSADNMYFALSNIADNLRTMLKHHELSKEQYEIMEKFKDTFYETLETYEIKL